MHIQFFFFLFTAIFLIIPSLPSGAMEGEELFQSRKKRRKVSPQLDVNVETNTPPASAPPLVLPIEENPPKIFFTVAQRDLLRSLGIHFDGSADSQPLSPAPTLMPTPEEERAPAPGHRRNSEDMNPSADPDTPSNLLSAAFTAYNRGIIDLTRLDGLKSLAIPRIPQLTHASFQSVFGCIGQDPTLDLFLFDKVGTIISRSNYLSALASLAWPTKDDFQKKILSVTFHIFCLTNLWNNSFTRKSPFFSHSEIQSFLNIPIYSIFSVFFNIAKINDPLISPYVLTLIEQIYKEQLERKPINTRLVIELVAFEMTLMGKTVTNHWSTIEPSPLSNHILKHISWPPDLPFTLFTPIESKKPSIKKDTGSQMFPRVPTNLSPEPQVQHPTITPPIVPLSEKQKKASQQSLEKRLADLTEWKTITSTYEVKTSILRGNHVARHDECPMAKQDYEKILLLLNKIDPHMLTAICKNKHELLKREIKDKLDIFLNENTL